MKAKKLMVDLKVSYFVSHRCGKTFIRIAYMQKKFKYSEAGLCSTEERTF